ncbi:hypothetical protein ACIOHE_15690 [Streptomyces sp. NPDC087851]|uniref:hypothetical protein n=1 Tax=Streptomyces sp. NPDC087851 TaxID=3365810 RepID=UPI00382F3C83
MPQRHLEVTEMAGTGPAPKPDDQRRRRNATVAMTKLPAAGRPGPAPAWPLQADIVLKTRRDMAERAADDLELALLEPRLKGRAKINAQKKADTARAQATILTAQLDAQQSVEAELWVELWATPQAVEWERSGWTREVAQYVRWKGRAEAGDLDAGKEARQLGDRLGLTPLSMLRLRWEVTSLGQSGLEERRPAARKASTRSAQTRRRLKVVEDKGDG